VADKLTNLAELTSPVGTDLVYGVDVSDTTDDPAGSSRAIAWSTVNQFFVIDGVGDNVADDTAAVQAALDAASVAGGYVIGKPGAVYRITGGAAASVEGLTITTPGGKVVILGAGWRFQTNNVNDTAPILTVTDAEDHFAMYDATFYGGGKTSNTGLKTVNTSKTYINNCYFYSLEVGINFHNDDTATGTRTWSEDVTLADSHIGQCGTGVLMSTNVLSPSFAGMDIRGMTTSNCNIHYHIGWNASNIAGKRASNWYRSSMTGCTMFISDAAAQTGILIEGKAAGSKIHVAAESTGSQTDTAIRTVIEFAATAYETETLEIDCQVTKPEAYIGGATGEYLVNNQTSAEGPPIQRWTDNYNTGGALEDGTRQRVTTVGTPFSEAQTFTGTTTFDAGNAAPVTMGLWGGHNAIGMGGFGIIYNTGTEVVSVLPMVAASTPQSLTGTAHTLTGTPAAKLYKIDQAATDLVITVPLVAALTTFTIGQEILFVRLGAGEVDFVADSGVTIVSEAGNLSIAAVNTVARLVLIDKDAETWLLTGNLKA